MSVYRGYGSSTGFGAYLTQTVKTLMIINVGLFILIHLAPRFPWLQLLGLVPRDLFMRLRIWQLFTYMFVHAGLGHLVINMLMLWFFAPAIESAWGRRDFLIYYFFTGVGAGLCSWLTAARSAIPVVGASGAIFGILVAYALMFPDTIILLFFIFPMKIRHAVLFLAGINLLGALSAPQGGIAYFAHLGGGLFGYLYLKYEWIRRQLAYWNWSILRLRPRTKPGRKKKTPALNLEQQIDKILDKVSKYGLDSLSRQERKILESKSKER